MLTVATAGSAGAPAVSSWPPDATNYQRPAISGDTILNRPVSSPALAIAGNSGTTTPGIFVTDPNSVDFNSRGEPSIAIRASNTNTIDIHGGFGGWNGNADLFHSSDGGLTWTYTFPINSPPGGTGTSGCPCDTAIDWGTSFLAGAFLTSNIYSGTTADPTVSANMNWFQPTPGTTQLANNGDAASIGNVDQPWSLVNRDATDATKQNVYVAYDDFSAGPDMRIAVAALPNTGLLNFNRDNKSGASGGGGINPGHRLATDTRTGFVYSLWQFNNGGGSGTARPSYIINRSEDNGQTWPLNGGNGLTVATADSDQPNPKFGTVNCLLGGVDHAAADPVTGDVYVVYGNRDSGTGNNRLAIRKLQDDGSGSMTIGSENFVTGQVQAALPSVAVAADGTVGVLYDTFDGLSSDGFPIFTAISQPAPIRA